MRHWTAVDGQDWAKVVVFHHYVCIAWKIRQENGTLKVDDILEPFETPGDDPDAFCTNILRAYFWLSMT